MAREGLGGEWTVLVRFRVLGDGLFGWAGGRVGIKDDSGVLAYMTDACGILTAAAVQDCGCCLLLTVYCAEHFRQSSPLTLLTVT